MEEDFLKQKGDLIKSLKASVNYFSEGNKWNREKWVVETLLSSLGVLYDESELSECDEPVDVAFRDGRFQIKEVMQFPDGKHRRRHDDYRSALQKAEAAETLEELTSLTPYRQVTWDQIVTESLLDTKARIQKYPVDVRRKLDVICYYNRHDHFEAYAPTPEFEAIDCRSFSVVSNASAMVLSATPSSPTFLQAAIGVRRARRY